MKQSEINIGDWVKNKCDQSVIQIKTHWDIYNAKDFDPVEITPEILEKNDIQRTGYYSYEWGENDGYEHGSIECADDGDAFLIRAFAQDPCLGKVEGRFRYVHDLQHALKFCNIKKEITL